VKLRLEQSVASQHLAILRRAGIVATSRDGKFINYSVSYTRLAEVVAFVETLVGLILSFYPYLFYLAPTFWPFHFLA
jgi:DNA-binding transcriptional ArsR family regulator